MKVETYELPDVADMAADERECAAALVNKLGLNKQKPFFGGGRHTQPFRQISHEEHFVFKQLCPVATALEKYESGPIPLRVLELADRAKDTGFFREFMVWHPADVRTDPVLVGVHQNDENTWNTSLYLIARWGEALDEFPALVKQAWATAKAKLSKARGQLAQAEAAIEGGNFAALTASFDPYVAGALL